MPDANNDSVNIPSDFFEKMPSGVAYCKMLYQDGKPHDFIYLYVNPAFYLQTGLDNVIGKPVSEVIPKLNKSNPELLKIYASVAAGGESKNFEIFIAESQQWFSIQAFSPKAGHFVAIFNVINQRKFAEQAEAATSELYHRLTKIASRVPGVIYQYKLKPDGSSCFPYASEAIRDIYRVSPEQVREDASDVYAILHPDDYDGIVASIQQSASSLEPWQYEYRVRFADGTVRWLYGNAVPHKQEDGAILWHGFITDISHRKQIEQALHSESIKNQVFLRNASDGITIMNYDGNIVEVSDSFCTMLGYSREEMLGMHVSQWDASLDKLDPMPIVRQQFEKKSRVLFETRHRRKDGTCYDAEISGFPIELDGQPLLFNSTRDITDRKRLERQLLAAMQETHDLYDYAPCGYHSINKNGILININSTELQWLGYTSEEIIGKKKISDFFTPESQARYNEILPKFLINGYIKDLEFEMLNKNGNSRQVVMSATAIQDNNGQFLKSRSVVYDITELKNTQKMLHQITLEQQAMLNNDLVGIVKLYDRKIIWVNKAMERMFGYSTEEMLGQLTRIFYLDDAAYQALGKACYPILSAHGIYRTQIEMLRKNGEKIWIDLNGVELAGDDNASVWMLSDITALKKYQQKIEQIAYHDILTGLPNRLLIADRLTQALAQAKRTQQQLAVCYIDLDGFKPINDKFGHLAGDKVLIEIARRMLTAVRAHDTVGRLGGDEFVLLLTNLEKTDEYQTILERFIQTVNQPISLGKSSVSVGASIGVTVFPRDNNDSDILLRHADQAMYHAKQSGRNRVCLFSIDD
jgi:diguanylate cyclase (GGDEF)-like protein/PAS domain S-box-containing protein